MPTLVLSQKPLTKLENYCFLYHIDKALIPVLQNLNKNLHYLFHKHVVIETSGERYTIIPCGWYSGVGANAKRIHVTHIIRDALRRSGLRYEAFNDAPRKGVVGNKIKIWY